MAALLLLLAACSREQPIPDTPGSRLEQAAIARGLVVDPQASMPVGSWANESDRLCVVPAGRALRVGASVDYGQGQGCAATGTADRHGSRLDISFGACRFRASYDGERIVFPPELPPACDRFCVGRASLTALAVRRLSNSASEAAALRSPNAQLLCGS